MSTIREDLEQFHQFVADRLAAGTCDASLEELFTQWHDSRSRAEINDAIRRGLADIDRGHYSPADRAMDAIRDQFGYEKE